MGESFIKFKRKAWAICWIKTVAIGLATGMLLAGAFLLLSKFEIIAMPLEYALFIGLGGMLLSGVIAFLCLYRSDRAIARQLDEQFALDERTQTMLAYGNQEGVLYDLQRKDANESLAAVPLKDFKFKDLWIYILCVCIGVSSLVTGLVVTPEEEIIPDPPPEAFAITDIQVAAMEELIAYVENSQMQSPYKESVSQSLRDLLESLKVATVVTQKDEALGLAKDHIYRLTDDSSAAVEFMDALWISESESLKRLAEALNYYDWPQLDQWEYFSKEMTDFRTSFIHADTVTETPDAEKMARETGELLLRVESNLSLSFTRVALLETDDLYVQLNRFALANETYSNGTHLYGCQALGQIAEVIGYETTQKELDATFAAVSAGIFKGLEQHAANTGTGEYALTRLDELFDCGVPKFERPNFYVVSEDDDTGGDEEGGINGGVGVGGETVYGSDDLVLDPITNTYVEYGTILDKYYALMFGKVDGGAYTDQEIEAMEKYFAILYGGFDEEEGE